MQGDISNSAQVNFNQTTDGTYVGSISGAGNMAKQGIGKLILSGNHNYTGDTAVESGELKVNGSLSNSLVTISSGATVSGIGTIKDIINNGTVTPGNSIGTLNIIGDYTQNIGSVLEIEIEIDNTGASDLLNITGNAFLNGGTLNIVPLPGNYTPITYTIITTGGNVIGTFSNSVLLSSIDLTSSVNYLPQSVQIVLSQADINKINAINDLYTPTYSEGTPDTVQSSLNSKYDILVQELYKLSYNKDNWEYVWLLGYRSDSKIKDTRSSVFSDSTGSGFILGYRSILFDDFKLGVSIGQENMQTSNKYDFAKINSEQTNAAVYLSYRYQNVTGEMIGIGSYTRNSVKKSTYIPEIDRSVTGKWNTYGTMLSGGLGYELNFDSFGITPYISLQAYQVSEKKYDLLYGSQPVTEIIGRNVVFLQKNIGIKSFFKWQNMRFSWVLGVTNKGAVSDSSVKYLSFEDRVERNLGGNVKKKNILGYVSNFEAAYQPHKSFSVSLYGGLSSNVTLYAELSIKF